MSRGLCLLIKLFRTFSKKKKKNWINVKVRYQSFIGLNHQLPNTKQPNMSRLYD